MFGRLIPWTKRKFEAIKKFMMSIATGIITALTIVLTTLSNPVLAANTSTSTSINWTDIGGIISGAGSIMPSVVSLVTAIVPVILVLIVVGFVVGLFDGLIGGIQDALRFFRR